MSILSRDCDYSTDWMPYSELKLKLSAEGGYITSDTKGGYYSIHAKNAAAIIRSHLGEYFALPTNPKTK